MLRLLSDLWAIQKTLGVYSEGMEGWLLGQFKN